MGYRAILDVAVYVLSHPQIYFLDESVAPSEKWTLRGHAPGSGVLWLEFQNNAQEQRFEKCTKETQVVFIFR